MRAAHSKDSGFYAYLDFILSFDSAVHSQSWLSTCVASSLAVLVEELCCHVLLCTIGLSTITRSLKCLHILVVLLRGYFILLLGVMMLSPCFAASAG